MGALVLIPSWHIAVTSLQCWEIDEAMIQCTVQARTQLAAVDVAVPLRGGLCFPRPLAAGIRIVCSPDGHTDLFYEDSDLPMVRPLDVAAQYLVGLFLLSLIALGVGGISSIQWSIMGKIALVAAGIGEVILIGHWAL